MRKMTVFLTGPVAMKVMRWLVKKQLWLLGACSVEELHFKMKAVTMVPLLKMFT